MSAQNAWREFHNADRLLGRITREGVIESMRAMAGWLGEARDAARGKGVGYRDIVYFRDGRFQWLYPHSNAGEQIHVFLWLHEFLGDDRCLQHAVEYADVAIADPVRGIYRGECREAHGLPWYWPDIGTYGAMYGMRFPYGFHMLYQKTGKKVYEEYMRLTAEPLVTRLTKIGLIDAGWSPKRGWDEGSHKVGSRIGYAMGPLALMYRVTKDRRYADALDRMIGCFERLQNPDGSFCQVFDTGTGAVTDPSIKNHFLGYILNGLTDAYAWSPDDRLLTMARKLAEFIVTNFYYRQVVPYCAGQSPNASDMQELDSPVIDPATGLFKLFKITKEPHHLDVALKLWWHYYTWQTFCPERPELHGAVLQGQNPDAIKYVKDIDRSREAVVNPHRIAHVCIYYQNQYVLSTEQLLSLHRL